MIVISVCAQHSPLMHGEIAPDGQLHVSTGRLSELRRESAAHIGACSRGPIVAIPVHVQA